MSTGTVRISILRAAALEIAQQASYYRRQADERLASKWRSATNQAALSLRSSPMRGALCHFSSKQSPAIRRLPSPGFTRHHLFYQVHEETNRVIIVAVLHDARDYDTILSSDRV